MEAAEKGHVAVVRILLVVETIEPQQSDRAGRTALLVAVARGQWEVVKAMAASPKVDFNCTRTIRETALSMAIKAGHV